MATSGRGTLGSRLRMLRLARGLSQVDLARIIGRHQTAIGPYERDEYAPPREIVERMAAALGSSPQFILFGRDPTLSVLAPMGRMIAGGVVLADDRLALVGLAEAEVETLAVEDDCMAPVFRPGQLLLVRRRIDEPASLLGREVVAQLVDGRQMVRRLMPAAAEDRFALTASAAPPLLDVEVVSARLIAGVLWDETLTRVTSGLSSYG